MALLEHNLQIKAWSINIHCFKLSRLETASLIGIKRQISHLLKLQIKVRHGRFEIWEGGVELNLRSNLTLM